MLNRGFGGAGGGLGAGASSLGQPGNSADSYYRMLETYGTQIAQQEAQLVRLREQRAAIAAEIESARQQRDAAAELAAAARSRTAGLQAERRTKEADLQAIQDRNGSLRTEVEALRGQLEEIRQQEYGKKAEFVHRCMQLEAQIRSVLAAHPGGQDAYPAQRPNAAAAVGQAGAGMAGAGTASFPGAGQQGGGLGAAGGEGPLPVDQPPAELGGGAGDGAGGGGSGGDGGGGGGGEEEASMDPEAAFGSQLPD
ncbi:hypothetical protein GPECTOR_162g135 [Gonium pectorale]|uniref:Uncharacterized protein n=1 Tax=Gonium pectorale TaxID=33097 RepID=A0A150FZ37_GONPE|nr:hypothetical protein GPECTOR_162g135 [Gonium pectorale]|eukprot:KXZ42320.1 hypothetical protein GPECTOR_162g135 [Gonium pectorale]